MKKLMIFIFVFLLSACATTRFSHTFLSEPNRQILKEPDFPSGEKFNFSSAKSVKENSTIEIGAWLITVGNQQIFRFDVKIINISNDSKITPDDIIIVDADKVSLKLFRPDEVVYYIEGMTSEEAIAQSTSMSTYAAQLQQSQGYTGTMYSYGSTFGNYSTFSLQPSPSPYSGFASGFARGMALGMAARAARINRAVRQVHLQALKPIVTMPHVSNVGKVFSLTGKLPIELHIFTLEDHHIIKLGQIQKKM